MHSWRKHSSERLRPQPRAPGRRARPCRHGTAALRCELRAGAARQDPATRTEPGRRCSGYARSAAPDRRFKGIRAGDDAGFGIGAGILSRRLFFAAACPGSGTTGLAPAGSRSENGGATVPPTPREPASGPGALTSAHLSFLARSAGAARAEQPSEGRPAGQRGGRLRAGRRGAAGFSDRLDPRGPSSG